MKKENRKKKIEKQIYKYLQTQILMSVSTSGKDIPWPAIVHFLTDEDLNLYFISNPKSQHCLNIEANPRTAIAIYDSTQSVGGEKIGKINIKSRKNGD